ncbi:hypothetical protein Tsubulata_015759 [Turnera subulata]|uniref:Myb/SANT-like domain-containing protein n=1 Tax=Turnera subulata TaxID=218843 RepID=A0A9Q0GDJ1_9ROSI|nr:hypothetical protein Tsubulata_015759 [Turnera subulata]
MSSISSSKHVWTPEEDEKLIQAMLELKEKGTYNNEEKGGFRKGHAKELVKILAEKLPEHGLTETHVSSRCKTLRKIYVAMCDLKSINGSGFGWDEEKKMFTAPASVWNDYVKSHPDASSLRGKPFLYYDEMSFIYGQDRATGEASKVPRRMQHEVDVEENSAANTNKDNDGLEDDLMSVADLEVPTGSTKGGTSSKSTRKRSKGTDGLVACLDHLTDVVGAAYNRESEDFGKLVDILASSDRKKEESMIKLNEELRKIRSLSFHKRHEVGMKLVRDLELLNYFLRLEDDEKEPWIMWYLSN